MLSRALALATASLLWLACGDEDTPSTSGDTNGSGGDASAGGSSSNGGGQATGGAGGEPISSAGGSGGSGGSGAGVVGTDGCGQPAADPSESWIGKTLDVDSTTREWFVWLPANYDPETPYPVVYQFHGCSSSANKENNNPPVQAQSGDAAIHIRGRAVGNCWDTAANGADVAFFDALVAEVEATWCADVDRRFATGYSSGAFMTHRLACDRGDVLRGVASIAGGLGGNDCNGQVAALLIHDLNDSTVNISASESARDRHLANNGCDSGAATTPTEHAPCEAYASCDAGYPVVWCQTAGQDHSRQDGLSAPAFWDFLSAL